MREVPSLLDRLVLRETLAPLLVGLLAILQLLVLAQLLQLNEVVFGSAVSLADLLRVTLALLPHFLVTAIPLAFMLCVQLGLGRLAGDREVLALSAAGSSPLLLYRVPLLLACALGLFTAVLARWAEPWGLRELNRVLNGVIKRNLESGLQPGVFNDGLPRFMIYVADLEKSPGPPLGPSRWRGVLIEDANVSEGQEPMLALAEEGRILDAGGEALALELERGEIHRMEPTGETVAHFRTGMVLVGVQERVSRKNRFSGSEAALSAAELDAQARLMDAAGRRQDAARLGLERARRVAVPLACLAFALLGVPLALASGGARGAAYLVTLGAFVGFYALSRIAVSLADSGVPGAVAAFVPDLSVAALGALFTWRLARRGVEAG